jgi:hypothetical protein
MSDLRPGQVWGPAEAKKAITGRLPEPIDPNHDLYLAWIRDCDARKCHSLALTSPSIDPLLRARAMLFRGELKDAREVIQSVNSSESLLEAARLAAYEGDWPLSRELSTIAIESGTLEPVSYLSCLQVRALAQFELGRLLDAKADLVSAESLGSVFPHSISWHYARVLSARIAARDEGVSSGLTKLDQIWNALIEQGSVTSEQAHALIFGEIDIWRWEALRSGDRGPLERLVLTSWAMTEASGERLYCALASVDAALFGPRALRGHFLKKARASSDLSRIKKVLDEVFGTSQPTSGTTELQRAHAEKGPTSGNASSPQINYVADLKRQIAFQIAPWQLVSLAGHFRVQSALRALARGPLAKEAFFASIWGNAKYSPVLHDSSISNLLNRVKKVSGIPIRIRAGRVAPPAELVVL